MVDALGKMDALTFASLKTQMEWRDGVLVNLMVVKMNFSFP